MTWFGAEGEEEEREEEECDGVGEEDRGRVVQDFGRGVGVEARRRRGGRRRRWRVVVVVHGGFFFLSLY